MWMLRFFLFFSLMLLGALLIRVPQPVPHPATPPTARFVLQEDEKVVLDRFSGLHWQRGFSPPMLPEAAVAWCKTVKLPGTGWRAPTAGELWQLIELHRQLQYAINLTGSALPGAPQLLDPLFEPLPKMSALWSSSTAHVDKMLNNYHWIGVNGAMSLAPGKSEGDAATLFSIRCVR